MLMEMESTSQHKPATGGHHLVFHSTRVTLYPRYRCLQRSHRCCSFPSRRWGRETHSLLLSDHEFRSAKLLSHPKGVASSQLLLADWLLLEFSKFALVVTWLVSYQVSHLSDNKSLKYTQRTIFNMAAVRHFEFAKFWFFLSRVCAHKPFHRFSDFWQFLQLKFASAHRISSKSDDLRQRYSDKTIFKMAAVRHFEFVKFGILVTWSLSEHYSAYSYQIFDNKSFKYSRKTISNWP